METSNDRLITLRQELGMTQAEMAEALCMSKPPYQQIERKERTVTVRHAMMLRRTYEVNDEWLLTGEGDMFLDRFTSLRVLLQERWRLTDKEAEYVKEFITASTDERQTFLKALEILKNWHV